MTDGQTGYTYTSAVYTNPSVQHGLESLLSKTIREFDQTHRICDLGCGNGRFALRLADRGHDVVGVDISTTDIVIAQEAAGTRRNVAFIRAEIDERLPVRLLAGRKAFDTVLSVDVIEHLYQPRILMEIAWSVLRPGGYLVICTPYHGYLKNLAISLLGKWDAHHGVHWDGGHIKFFSVHTLTEMLCGRGFIQPKFSFFGRAPYLWKNMICVVRKPVP